MTDLTRYPEEVLGEDDDGTMVENKKMLEEAVVGHRIVSATCRRVMRYWSTTDALILELDNQKQVVLADTDDCCAYTALEAFLLDPASVDHVITGVGTTEGYTTWHVYADMGDVLRMQVGWSCGNPFYYAYGFDIRVEPITLQGEIVRDGIDPLTVKQVERKRIDPRWNTMISDRKEIEGAHVEPRHG
jgi:hypothetical protein